MRVQYTVFRHTSIYSNISYCHTSTSGHQCQQGEQCMKLAVERDYKHCNNSDEACILLRNRERTKQTKYSFWFILLLNDIHLLSRE